MYIHVTAMWFGLTYVFRLRWDDDPPLDESDGAADSRGIMKIAGRWSKKRRSPRFRNDFSVRGKNGHGCCGDNMKMCDVNLHHLVPCKTDPSHPSNIRRPAAKVQLPSWGMATVMLEHHVAFATSLTAKRFVSINTSVSSCSLSMQATSSAGFRWV